MKLIGPVAGVSAFRAPAEEVGSSNGAPLQDFISLITGAFQFASPPILGPAPAHSPPRDFSRLSFQNGKIDIDGQPASIFNFTITSEGILTQCRRTEIADTVLDQISEILDLKFGCKYRQSTRPRLRSSAVVVQFDVSFSKQIGAIAGISAILSNAIDRRTRDLRFADRPFSLKRISFGDEAGEVLTPHLFENLERADFVMDARIQHDLSENVFFCSAPLPTTSHIETLEELERAAVN